MLAPEQVRLYIEQGLEMVRELYLGAVIDRDNFRFQAVGQRRG